MLYCIKYTHTQTNGQTEIPFSRAPVWAKNFESNICIHLYSLCRQITVYIDSCNSILKLSSVKFAARWCPVPVQGVGPDQSEPRDDTRLCPGSRPRFYPQIAPQLPAWRHWKSHESSLRQKLIWDYYYIASWANNLCKSSKGFTQEYVLQDA